MTIDEITDLSVNILTRYYDNDIQAFLDCCHDDVLWLGPAKEHLIRTKKALSETFGNESNPLHFTLHNLTATPVHISSTCTEVLMTFIVDTFWPDGSTNRVFQRITLTWNIKKDVARIRVCHISNPIDYDNRDGIYPIHYLESHSHMTLYREPSTKLSFNRKNKSILYTSPDQIMYIENTGNHTIIQMASQSFECTERLSSIAKRIGNTGLIRCHASYLANPLYVQSIERFSLTMANGKKIPIPEKKYTAVKAMLLQ